ncbi:N-acetyltransferase [Paenibacillus chitinolyticus]|uniref:N-acetyltransferase n=1 Tax=Paenibacillus chitinolyticus TaxID=79263 RepID=A0A410WUJ7_9BACL|nr:GNAT family N-acetyltransferase [Paenibacillus chitinolyticus]MCY9593646.1 GNAT family N-acetyltransferase [Paenibacillus chitinolyticus]MCY9595082.1 GNAT family N-acetyltransferase [Paenibacillus chitinolyticus]QAV17947.1 N-acetyltransferase [Paenibacillus chitinolyticus]
MIVIRKLSECTLDQAVQVWNAGFSGYLVDMTTNPDAFMTRQAYEQLSPQHSIVAFDGEQPVGFVLNGIRMAGARKISWNGGTGVIPAHRGRGVGRKLIEASLDIYRKEGVDTATIEAFASNVPAIALYESVGYVTRDTLLVLRKAGGAAGGGPAEGTGESRGALGDALLPAAGETGGLPDAAAVRAGGLANASGGLAATSRQADASQEGRGGHAALSAAEAGHADGSQSAAGRYTLRHGTARDAGLLPFYPALGAWQVHWASLTAGESLIMLQDGKPAGYALYKRVYEASGKLAGVTLYQCEASPDNREPETVLRTLLEAVLDGYGEVSFSASHIPSSRTDLLRLLEEKGFQTVHELVWMTRDMTEEGRA